MTEKISKVDAARRQLDTAIDLYFNDADALSCFTLAYAGLKVLLDIYPHHQEDGFAKQIDEILGKEGWRHLSGVGNFLKHADRDPDGVLQKFHPDSAYTVLGLTGLAGILMRNTLILTQQVADNFKEGMPALDAVVEAAVRRARPVVLTALAAVFAFVPLTFDSFWGPLAYVLIGGVAVGTAITLLFVPALYALWFRIDASRA
jgi:hypothetical protein